MALSWVDNSYWSYAWWEYYYTGSTGVAVRKSPSTSATVYYRMSNSNDLWAWVAVDETSQQKELWIHHNGGSNHNSWGWSATKSGSSRYFTLMENSQYISSGYWSGTAWAYYYYPNAGSTSYTHQASASRSSPSFTLRASPGSNTVDSGSSTITLTVNYNNGSANATQNGTKFTRTVYSFSGWDEKTSASAPSSLTAGTNDYPESYSRSDTRDLYYYADYTSSASTQYSNNTRSLGTPTKASTSTTYTVNYNANNGTVSPTKATASQTTTYRFSQWTGSTGVSINSSKVATFTQTGTATASYTSSTGAVGTVTLPTPTRTNYIFNGWLAPNGQTYAAGASYRPTSTSETLTAQWTLNQITLTLANSASWTGSYAPTGGGTLTPGANITLIQPIKDGWHFVSWTNASGTVLSYNATFPTTAPTSSTTYTANVARNTYKVRYDSNGGSGTMAESNHTYGVASNLRTNTFTKNGATFVGWATSSNATSADYTDGASISTLNATNGGITILYAVWRAATNMYIYTNNKWTPALKYVYTSNAPSTPPVAPKAEFDTTWANTKMTFSYSNGRWTAQHNTFTVSNIGNASGSVTIEALVNDGDYPGVTCVIKNSNNQTVTSAVTIAAGASQTFTFQVSGTPTAEYTNENIGYAFVEDGEDYMSYIPVYINVDLPDPEPTYTNSYSVAAVSGSTYTFTNNGAGYYESNNKGVNSSYALARTTVTTDGTKYVIVEYVVDSEIYFDVGIVSALNKTLSASTSRDSSNIASTYPDQADGFARSLKKINFGKLAAGSYTFDTKYIKDGSQADGADSMKFKVTFVSSPPTVLQSSCTYQAVSGASYGFGYANGWYYSQNNGVANSAAVGKLVIAANGIDRIYIDAFQSSQNSVDFGLISTNGATFSTNNTIDTANVLKSYKNVDGDATRIDLGVLAAGTYTYCIKFRKDGSGNYYDDCIQFRVYSDSADRWGGEYRRDSVTVEPVSGSTYTFALNSSGYYESNNKGVDSSYALAKVTVITTNSKYIVLDCINYAETGWDYGWLSTAGSTLPASYTWDTANIQQNFKNINKSSIYRVNYGKSYGKMTFYAKFCKDGSSSNYNDSLQFKVNLLSSLPAVLNSSWTYTSAGGTYQFIAHPFDDNDVGWIIPNNRGVNSSAAVSKITISANGSDHVYLDYYQSSEANYDYAQISAIGGTLSTSASADASYLARTYGASGYGTVDLGVLSAGTHTLYVKYLKDGSQHNEQDLCGFYIRFGGNSVASFPSIYSHHYLGEPTVNGATYGFFDNSDTVWQYQSRNSGVANSASVGRIYIRTNGFDPVYVDAYSFGESNFDYCILGIMDGPALSTNNTSDSSNVALATNGYQMQVRTYSCGVLPAGWHYIYIKYRKDGSVDSDTGDLGYFNVRFTSADPGSPPIG